MPSTLKMGMVLNWTCEWTPLVDVMGLDVQPSVTSSKPVLLIEDSEPDV